MQKGDIGMTEIFIVGKVNLNGRKSPFIEIVLDTANGRGDGDIILLKEIAKEDNDYYTNKVKP
jgi:hypothetical protein